MIRRINKWLRKWTITVYRNKLNSNIFYCLLFLIALYLILFPVLVITEIFDIRIRILISPIAILLIFSVVYFFKIIIYDISSATLIRRKDNFISGKKGFVKDLLKLLTVGHKNLTVERAKLNNIILTVLLPILRNEQTKSLAENLIEYYDKRFAYFYDENEYEYFPYSSCKRKFFLSGYSEIKEKDIEYLTHQYHKIRRKIREEYGLIELAETIDNGKK